jgi:hypothetical protein
MKTILLLVVLALLPLIQDPPAKTESGTLQVVKFSWTKNRENSDLIHGVNDPPSMNEPVSVARAPARNEPDAVRNNRDLSQRRADMIISEKNAANSAKRGSDFYVLRLELKNTGSQVTKNFIWEINSEADAKDYEPRQYVCGLKAKPNETKTIELVTPFNPAKVVTASETKNDVTKNSKATINRIEYADGAIWKRTGWSILIPKELTEGLENGKCVAF